MLFNSYDFILIYLPIVFAGAFLIGGRSRRLGTLWLACASIVFYGVWDFRYVPLLLASIVFNYKAGYWISLKIAAQEWNRGRTLLIAAIAVNLGLLGYFKYADFFLSTANSALGSDFPALRIVLPLGISFFTFTQIAFLVDVYRGFVREYDFLRYLLFVTYFPHLIAGPVLHHKQVMPQFAEPTMFRVNWENVAVGVTIFVLGLTKKVVFADGFAQYATPIFKGVAAGASPMLAESWIAALTYTLQIYFDFSGYSDMAIGLSLMFNVRLPLNFYSPYKSANIIDFWRRWHMTLSAFLRDYLYFPLGGNRKGSVRRYVNLMATMLIGGLWHGAGWTFVVWGGLHGLYLVVNHGWRKVKSILNVQPQGRIGIMAGGLLTFIAVVVGWAIFRSPNLASAGAMLKGMAGLNGIAVPAHWKPVVGHILGGHVEFSKWASVSGINGESAFLAIVAGLAVVWLFPNVEQMLAQYKPTWEHIAGVKLPAAHVSRGLLQDRLRLRLPTVPAVASGVLFFICLVYMGSKRTSEFLYFQF